jgi:hypothetical protein
MMADLIYTRIENGVVIDTVTIDEDSVELGAGGKLLTRLAVMHKGATLRGRVKGVANSGDFTLRGRDLSENDDEYKGWWLVLLNGEHRFIPRQIGTYTGSTKRVQFTGTNRRGPFPRTVEPGDRWILVDRDTREAD